MGQWYGCVSEASSLFDTVVGAVSSAAGRWLSRRDTASGSSGNTRLPGSETWLVLPQQGKRRMGLLKNLKKRRPSAGAIECFVLRAPGLNHLRLLKLYLPLPLPLPTN
jgi:hypothetical protein